jgi:ribosomal protein L14
VECVNILKHKVNNGWGSVGDEIVCVVKNARPISAATQASATAIKVRRGDVRRAVIVRTRKPMRRPDGRLVRFDDNAAVLLNNKREMLGTRISGVVSAELRMKGWGKIVSLAPRVLFSILFKRHLADSSYPGCMTVVIDIFNALQVQYKLHPIPLKITGST